LGNGNDVIALAQTGTGKTAAFGLPIIQKVDPALPYAQALILSPTRELCLQIADDLASFSKYVEGLRVVPMYGGTSIENQIRNVRKGVHIIVATPGRLIDLMERGVVKLSTVRDVVLDEADEDFSEILRHPRKDDPFWSTHLGGAESRDAVKNAKIPILLVTGFYDIYTGGIFDMWKALGDERRASCALAVHPFGHSGHCNPEPIKFDGGDLRDSFPDYCVRWMDSIRGKCEPPFPRGKVTYYRLFDGVWACDDFYDASESLKFALGEDSVSYKYNPYAPASFKGGLSTNFGGCEWQDEPNSRYDIISLFTPELEEDVTVKGQISARLRVSSDCEDTCFYMRISLCKDEGYYGLRDDINQISNIDSKYMPGGWVDMSFSFDEHAFVMKKGERLRIDISSSAFPHYVPHTNNRGLYSEQKTARVATNTVDLASSHIEIPIIRFAEGGDDKKGI
jgi:predicted acyl esterase